MRSKQIQTHKAHALVAAFVARIQTKHPDSRIDVLKFDDCYKVATYYGYRDSPDYYFTLEGVRIKRK